MSLLDTQIDQLYALPLADFTAARNALARSLKGDRAAVAAVKQLTKPSQVPWAVNLLYFVERPVWERLMVAGGVLRAAQFSALEGKTANLQHAGSEHRAALTEAVGAATRLATAAGATPTSDPLSRMLEALSLATTLPTRPGRFTTLVQPAGFEALAGVTSTLAPVAPRPSTAARTASPAADDQAARRAVDAETARRLADARAGQLRQQLVRAEATTALAQAQRDGARLQLERAESALAAALDSEQHLRETLAQAKEVLETLRTPTRND